MELDPTIVILSVLLVLLSIFVIRLEFRINKLLRGSDNKTLEGTIRVIEKGHRELTQFRAEVEKYLKNVEKRLSRSIQSIETIKFNPFKGTGLGGNQSFSTVFLDERGNGVIVSSLYARDRMSIFSKPIKKNVSEIELTDEEKTVLTKATDALSEKNGNR